jgi:pimeloyl-ACP methyl ester carboxylesterase
MSPRQPHCREAGSGAGVVCLHANASTSGQWRELMDLLAPRCHVLAPDNLGAGQSPDWPGGTAFRLRDEAEFLEPVFARAGTPLVLVGHSYGAAVALIAALADPGRVRAMALYEPTLFALIDAESPPPNAADGIRDILVRAGAALDAGDRDAAAGLFIDYWMGDGAWQQTPQHRRPAIAAATVNIRRWAQALFHETAPLAAFRRLECPILCLSGSRSTPAAHAVTRLLTSALPQVETMTFGALGHMGPVTHPEPVNAAIAAFLERA